MGYIVSLFEKIGNRLYPWNELCSATTGTLFLSTSDVTFQSIKSVKATFNGFSSTFKHIFNIYYIIYNIYNIYI